MTRRRAAALGVALIWLSACSAAEPPSAEPAGTLAPGTTLAVAAGANAPVGDEALPTLGDRDLDVEHYDLVLDYEPDGGQLDGVATLEVTARRPVDAIVLDLLDLEVAGVTVAGAPVAADHADGKLRVPLDRALAPGETTEVSVTYGGVPDATPTEALGGVEVGWQVRDGASFVLAEPEGARTWYPVNDHPTDKATYDITVTVPDDVVAIANGELVQERADGTAGTATYHWRMDRPMAPYLATVVTGGYTAEPSTTAGGVTQTVWTTGRDRGDGAAVLDAQTEALGLLEGVLGPFPFSTYAAVLLPPDPEEGFFDGVAIETQTVSLFGSRSVVPETVVHEAAHQWFGNDVSVTDWSRDIWWVEGFARYAEWLWIEDADGTAAYDDVVTATWDALAESSRPQPAGDLGLRRLFSPWSYDRGALTFAALRAQMGDEDFFAFLRAFVDRYGGANATTEDLIATAEDVSGADLGPLFEGWLYDEAVPEPPS